MTPATRNTVAGTSLAFLAILGGILYATRTPESLDNGRAVTVDWDGPVPEDALCLRTVGLASEAALALFRLDAGTPGQQYVYVRVCGSPVDAGGEAPVALPDGMFAFDEFQVEEAYDGGPQLRASLDGFPCACSRGLGTGCEEAQEDGGWGEARVGLTMLEGNWRGACRPKACVELAGVSSWPAGEGGCPE